MVGERGRALRRRDRREARMADVLVVDDDREMADLLADVLQSPEYELRAARDGARG
jgi:CheY-like chemotaxis protein